MSGRLGMSGSGYVRGDKVLGLAQVSKARPFVPPTKGQLKTWGATGAVALGAGGIAHERRKAGDRTSSAAAGAVSGTAATDAALGVGGYAAREAIQRGLANPKHKRTKATRKILSEHKAKYGVSEGPGKNPPNAYYRNYPHSLPLGRAQSLMGWKNNKYVVAGTLGVGAGVGAAVGGRKKEVASKADVQLMRNGKSLLHLQPANPEHKKIWGAPARMLVVGSGEKRPAGRILLPTRRQAANWAGGGALVYTGKKVVDHNVKKREGDHRRRNAVVGGTVAGLGGADLATNVAGWGTREGIKYHEQLVNAGKISHPMSRKARSKRLDEHKAAHGVGSNTKDAPQAYYREWPKELPGAKARQLMGHKNRPGVVAGILGTGAALGAGYGALRSRNVNKAAPLPHGTKIPRWEMQWRMNDKTPAPVLDRPPPGKLKNPQAYDRLMAEHRAMQPSTPPGKRKRTLVDRYLGRAGTGQYEFGKVDVTMTDKEAGKLAARYDTRGPLPKGLTREQKMKAYEARYVASGGKKAEKWKHRADTAETLRNVGLAGVTAGSAAFMAARGHKTGPALRRIKHIGPHLTKHNAEMAGAGSAVLGGTAELYGEHARSRKASYANSPAGVAGSALSRMRAYTPGGQS